MENFRKTPSTVPCLFDTDLSSLSDASLQSGIAGSTFLKIKRYLDMAGENDAWRPALEAGIYFLGTEQFRMFSDRCHQFVFRDPVATVINLTHSPALARAVEMYVCHRVNQSEVIECRHWRQRPRFSGTLAVTATSSTEQISLDSNNNVVNYNLAYADTTKDEFVLVRRFSATQTENIPSDIFTEESRVAMSEYFPDYFPAEYFPIGYRHQEGVISSFTLSSTPLTDCPIVFSNTNMFRVQVTTSPALAGEWKLENDGVTITVLLPAAACLPGTVTYNVEYPASMRLAKTVTAIHGDELGSSTGVANQVFFSEWFPLLSAATTQVLVFSDPLTYEEWAIVDDLSTQGPTAKACEVNLDLGLIVFGDGVHGAIPPEDYDIAVAYTSVPIVQYETAMHQEMISRQINLNPLYTISDRGFIYLAHYLSRVYSLVLSCDKSLVSISPEIYGPIYCGTDFARLTCQALNASGGAVDGAQIDFHLNSTNGYLNQLQAGATSHTWGDANGEARSILRTVSNVMQMSETIHLYDENNTYLDPYITTTITDDTLPLNLDEIDPNISLDDILTFAVLDDDPMLPYSTLTRTGGVLVVLYTYDNVTENFIPLKPIDFTKDYIQFGQSLPTPTMASQLRQFVIVIPTLATVYCQTTDLVTGRTITSNSLKFLFRAPEYQLGTFTLRELVSVAGSTVEAATYLALDRRGSIKMMIYETP
jgi:hypothetical protein